MTLAVWHGLAADESSGDLVVLASPSVTVTDRSDGSTPQVYANRDGTGPLGNPFAADANGSITFYTTGGRYRIEATSGGETVTWDDVLIGTAQGYDADELKAIANSGVYEDTASGLSNTSDTEYFWVPESGELTLYQNDEGSAVENSSYPDLPTVNEILESAGDARDAAQQAGNVYASTMDGLADTSDGDYFTVPESGRLVLYLNDSGSAVEQLKFAGPIGTASGEVPTADDVLLADPEHAIDGGTDAYASATNTSPPGDGVQIVRDFQSANTTTTPTLDGKTITDRDGNALWSGAISGVHSLQYDSGADTYLLLDANSGSWQKIESGTVSGASSLDLALPSGYRAHVLVFDDLSPDTNSVSLNCRFSADGGSTFESGGSAYGFSTGRMMGSLGIQNSDNNSTMTLITGGTVGDGSGESVDGTLWILSARSTGGPTRTIFDASLTQNGGGPDGRVIHGGRRQNASEENDAIRIYFSSGNIASMNYTLYGVQ